MKLVGWLFFFFGLNVFVFVKQQIYLPKSKATSVLYLAGHSEMLPLHSKEMHGVPSFIVGCELITESLANAEVWRVCVCVLSWSIRSIQGIACGGIDVFVCCDCIDAGEAGKFDAVAIVFCGLSFGIGLKSCAGTFTCN